MDTGKGYEGVNFGTRCGVEYSYKGDYGVEYGVILLRLLSNTDHATTSAKM